MDVLFFLLVGFSITNAVVFLHVFHWLRHLASGMTDREFHIAVELKRGQRLEGFRNAYLGRMVRCHACMGFWVGLLLSILYSGFVCRYLDFLSLYDSVIADGFLLSGFNFCVWVMLRKFGAESL